MENEIKVNEHVRYKDGNIMQIFQKIDCEYVIKDNKDRIYTLPESAIYEDIVKHSPNLIDLIECGDYVNGILVTGKESTLLWTEIKGIDRSGYHIPISQYGENIKSVVTKEQFESISYKVKE